ncbi:MAG: sigma-70 family RNA polymerase sigma factor [Myxococcales bacterium]|nr:sigma-70 family RNA polymerase sigma factor [Myxococcales bacterium]MCB9717481.1 sigma-70 family RNA polymerase sigma factor [Myxococcales bacterium]
MADDAELIRAWQEGDRATGARLFDRHYASVARFFRNKVGPQESADLVQSTFLACFEGLPRVQASRFRSYLFAVACNLLRKHFRSKHRARVELGTVSVFDLDPSPSAVLAGDQRQRQLLEALRRIPIEMQVVLELFYWESMTAAELAEVLEIPVGTAKTRIRRARQLLHEQMQAIDAQGLASGCTVEDLDAWAQGLRGEPEPS